MRNEQYDGVLVLDRVHVIAVAVVHHAVCSHNGAL